MKLKITCDVNLEELYDLIVQYISDYYFEDAHIEISDAEIDKILVKLGEMAINEVKEND